jgi:hypothetical protein
MLALHHYFFVFGSIVVVIIWYLDLQLPKQSVPITTNVVSSIATHVRCNRSNII